MLPFAMLLLAFFSLHLRSDSSIFFQKFAYQFLITHKTQLVSERKEHPLFRCMPLLKMMGIRYQFVVTNSYFAALR